MIHYVLLERVAHLVDKVHMHLRVIGIHLAATLVYRHEHRLYAACGLRHQTCRTGRGDCQAGDVAASVFHYVFIQLCVGVLYAQQERIVRLT